MGNYLHINSINMFFQVDCIIILGNYQVSHMQKVILKNSNSISNLYNYIMLILNMFGNLLSMNYKFLNYYNILMGKYWYIINESLKAQYHSYNSLHINHFKNTNQQHILGIYQNPTHCKSGNQSYNLSKFNWKSLHRFRQGRDALLHMYFSDI